MVHCSHKSHHFSKSYEIFQKLIYIKVRNIYYRMVKVMSTEKIDQKIAQIKQLKNEIEVIEDKGKEQKKSVKKEKDRRKDEISGNEGAKRKLTHEKFELKDKAVKNAKKALSQAKDELKKAKKEFKEAEKIHISAKSNLEKSTDQQLGQIRNETKKAVKAKEAAIKKLQKEIDTEKKLMETS